MKFRKQRSERRRKNKIRNEKNDMKAEDQKTYAGVFALRWEEERKYVGLTA